MISFPTLMLIGFLFGAAAGAFIAKRKGGKRNDIIHYALVGGEIVFIVVTVLGPHLTTPNTYAE